MVFMTPTVAWIVYLLDVTIRQPAPLAPIFLRLNRLCRSDSSMEILTGIVKILKKAVSLLGRISRTFSIAISSIKPLIYHLLLITRC